MPPILSTTSFSAHHLRQRPTAGRARGAESAAPFTDAFRGGVKRLWAESQETTEAGESAAAQRVSLADRCRGMDAAQWLRHAQARQDLYTPLPQAFLSTAAIRLRTDAREQTPEVRGVFKEHGFGAQAATWTVQLDHFAGRPYSPASPPLLLLTATMAEALSAADTMPAPLTWQPWQPVPSSLPVLLPLRLTERQYAAVTAAFAPAVRSEPPTASLVTLTLSSAQVAEVSSVLIAEHKRNAWRAAAHHSETQWLTRPGEDDVAAAAERAEACYVQQLTRDLYQAPAL